MAQIKLKIHKMPNINKWFVCYVSNHKGHIHLKSFSNHNQALDFAISKAML